MKCIKCNNEHDGSFGSGKYCSRACANSRIRTDEVKKKISIGVRSNEYWAKGDWKAKVIESNKDPKRITKVRETWKSKRDYDTAHMGSIKRWIKEEREYTCEECGTKEWNGKRLPMEVDHIDGDTTNNDISNLKVLCPNCHSQTPTWRKKK